MIDIHAHILPQIDDGAENIDMTLKMIKNAVKDEIDKIIATPHYCTEYWTNIHRKSASGYKSEATIYEYESCDNYAHKSKCMKAKGNIRMQVSKTLVEKRKISCPIFSCIKLYIFKRNLKDVHNNK